MSTHPEKFPWAERPGELHWPNPNNPDDIILAGFPHLVIFNPSKEQFQEMFDWLGENLGVWTKTRTSSSWAYRLTVESRVKIYYSHEDDALRSTPFDNEVVECHFYVRETLFPMFKLRFQ